MSKLLLSILLVMLMAGVSQQTYCQDSADKAFLNEKPPSEVETGGKQLKYDNELSSSTPMAEAIEDPQEYYQMGCEFLQQKKYQQALNNFNKALQLNPHYYEASYKKALVYQLTGYDKFAARRYQDILKYRPDFDQARINLAELHRKHKHYIGAEEQYQKVIEHNWFCFEAHYDLANVLIDQNKQQEALKEYKICLKLQPNNAKVHNNMGVIFLQKNYKEEALQEFKKAAHLEPTNQTYFSNISVAQKALCGKNITM